MEKKRLLPIKGVTIFAKKTGGGKIAINKGVNYKMQYIKGKIFDKSSWDFMNINDFAKKYKLPVDFVIEKKKQGWSTEEIIAKEKIEDTLIRCFG